MNRAQFDHIIRAAATIIEFDEIVAIGSQAVLGQIPNPPQECVRSAELDVFTMRSPDDALLIDGSIGEGSPFHNTFGYYAHGVGLETPVLPTGWADRAIRTCNSNTRGATAITPEVHDLIVSKLSAGRGKDLVYVYELLRAGLCNPELIRQRTGLVRASGDVQNAILQRLDRCLAHDFDPTAADWT